MVTFRKAKTIKRQIENVITEIAGIDLAWWPTPAVQYLGDHTASPGPTWTRLWTV